MSYLNPLKNIGKERKILGTIVYISHDYLVLLYNSNKLKIFTRFENNKINELDMQIQTFKKLYGWIVEID